MKSRLYTCLAYINAFMALAWVTIAASAAHHWWSTWAILAALIFTVAAGLSATAAAGYRHQEEGEE